MDRRDGITGCQFFPNSSIIGYNSAKTPDRFLTELDKADPENMGNQCSKIAQTLMKKNKMVGSLALAYIKAYHL